MLIRKKITALIFSFASVIFLLPSVVLAQVEQDFGTDTLSGIATASTRDLFDMVTGIVNTVLYFLGAITILLFLYAGWLWFTSQGNKDKIEKAKKIML
ncbi:MAG: Big 5 protein, partial [Patescibacteria group bacterium]|nr:Big 5 protein [Patescibacteria group bacterium]